MPKSIQTIVLSMILTCFLPWSARAQGDQAGARTHDGFFLRMAGGFGFASDQASEDDFTLRARGGAGNFDFAIGGTVVKNLALHVTLFDWVISNPHWEAESGGVTVSGDMNENSQLSMVAFGGGITYYFQPSNLYLSGSLGVGTLSLDQDDENLGETDAGIAMRLMLGHEWWVSNNWGLGLAGAIDFSSMPTNEGPDWKGIHLGILFSATYN